MSANERAYEMLSGSIYPANANHSDMCSCGACQGVCAGCNCACTSGCNCWACSCGACNCNNCACYGGY